MKARSHLLLASTTAAIVLLAGCSRPSDNAVVAPRPAAVDAAAIARADASISQPAWLDQRLPANTVAYLRVPSPWGTLSAPDGRALDAALASDQHARIIASLRKAIRDNQDLANTEAGPLLQLLLADQSGPIEVAMLDDSGGITPASRAFATVPLDLPDVAALNQRIDRIRNNTTSPLQAPVDAHGDASLQKLGALHFDVANHRLFLTFGTTASTMTLQQDIARTGATHASPIQDEEKLIDASGQGLFAWASLKGMGTVLEQRMQDLPQDGLLRDAAEHAESISLGWGTVDGHGRLRVQVRAPKARLLGYLAPDSNGIALKTAGRPNWAILMSLPSASNLHAIHDGLDRDFGQGTRAAADTALGNLQGLIGMDPIAFGGMFGPQWLSFSDASGRFGAIRVRDRKLFYAKLGELSKRPGWKLSTLTLEGATVHALQAPSWFASLPAPASPLPGDAAIRRALARIDNHLYWIDDGDYLVLSAVPQALADRVNSHPSVPLGEWLKQAQAQDGSHTLLGFAATTHDAQREVYYLYLRALQTAGDLLGQPVDLAGLPSASKLKLPVEGALGMALQADDQRLSLQMTYEQTPVEALAQGSGVGAVAVVSILAAIAIPAYHDYVIHAQVSEAASLSHGAKTAVAEYYANRGTMPRNNADAGLAEATSITGTYVSSVRIDDGRIIATFGNKANAAIQDDHLIFAPTPGQGMVQWRCDTQAGTDIPEKYRPSLCR